MALDASRSASTRPGPTRPDSTPPDLTRPGPTRPGSTPPDLTRPGSTRPGSTPPDLTRPGSTPPDLTRADSTPPDLTRADSTPPAFTLPAELEAHDPPEARGLARDGVRMLVSRRSSGQVSEHAFRDLPGLLLPGDLLIINNTGTLPAQVRAADGLAVHFSTPLPDGAWLVELRQIRDTISIPNGQGFPGQVITLPAGAVLTVEGRATGRLWRARLSVAVVPYLLRHGVPIRYSYVRRDWPLAAYQTVFARQPGSAEMPSASRPFTPALVTELAARGVLIAPLTLHAGVSSLEAGEDPFPEPYDVPPATARLVNYARAHGGRVIAAGTTVVRALETAARADGSVVPSAGWTSHVVTPQTGVRVADGLLTGLHEPRSSHLRMLAAFAGPELLSRCYQEAIRSGYLWHEFGDVHLLLP